MLSSGVVSLGKPTYTFCLLLVVRLGSVVQDLVGVDMTTLSAMCCVYCSLSQLWNPSTSSIIAATCSSIPSGTHTLDSCLEGKMSY